MNSGCKKIELWCAGTAFRKRFAVMVACDGKPVPVWVGMFGAREKTFSPNGGRESAECSAVEKAFWVGWRVAEGMGCFLNVSIFTSHRFDQRFASRMSALGKSKRVRVSLFQLPESQNPAIGQLDVWEFMRPDLARAARCVQVLPFSPKD